VVKVTGDHDFCKFFPMIIEMADLKDWANSRRQLMAQGVIARVWIGLFSRTMH